MTIYGSVILLLRNPYDAMVAERHRSNTKRENGVKSHNFTVGPEYFGNSSSWNKSIKRSMSKWIDRFIKAIVESPPHIPKLVVRYEDLKRDRVKEVSRMLDFLHFPYSHETLSQQLLEDYGSFHRSQHAEFEAFTASQEEYVDKCVRDLLHRLSAEDNGVTYGIEEYLRHNTA
jgi:hypothetical protein